MTEKSEKLLKIKGKISVLTKYLQKMTFELRRLQKEKDRLEEEK